MRNSSRLISLASIALLAAFAPSAAAEPQPAVSEDVSQSFQTRVRPLLAEFCFSCHGPEKHKGDLNLASFETVPKVLSDVNEWRDVRGRLREMEMPPKSKKQPSDEQRQMLIDWIGKAVGEDNVDCSRIATDQTQKFYRGHVMGRRLNRTEYGNTLRDLFGIDLHAAESLPEDGAGGEGFDTDGDTLFVSAISVERYLAAADRVLQTLLEARGRLPSPQVDAARRRLLMPTGGAQLPARAAAELDIKTFCCRAFRRPVTTVEVERLMTLFDRAQGRGETFASSLRLALKAVLISPNFLFLAEPAGDQEGVYPLGDYAMASRLSYFFWSSMPDDELFALAAAKRLHDPQVLRQQARRLLCDPRSRALAENFSRQWLGISALGSASRPDTDRFPEFDDDLATAMRDEAVLLVDSVFREDRSLLDLLDARFTFLNARLAKLYGIEGVSGSEMRKVALTDPARGGVLGLAAVLTTTSYPLRTSPVLRGKWVLERILGEKMRPPPPTAGQLPQDDHQTDGLTFRQRLEQHRSRPECASCHQRMDPLGFGLENFDAMGRWRIMESGGSIDASGRLTSGEQFNGPAGLRQVLLKHKDQFLANFCHKMIGYGLGRGLSRFDECIVKETLAALAANDDRASALFEQIVLSRAFQYRYAKK